MQNAPSPFPHFSQEISKHLQQRTPLPPALVEPIRMGIGKRGQGNMALAQINTTPGDLEGNATKIMRYLSAAEHLGLDLIAFPELALMGYPPRDIITRHPFLVEENLKWLHALAQRTGDTYALVGFVEPRKAKPGCTLAGKPFYNSMAVLGQGKIQAIVRKTLLPAYGEFEDVRQFEPSPVNGVLPPQALTQDDWSATDGVEPFCRIHGKDYALFICEDMWSDAEFFQNPRYPQDPLIRLAEQKPNAILNISASPSRAHKEQIRHTLCAHLAQKYQSPFIYINQVGSIDEVSFDGASRAYDAHGQLIARASAFEEQFLIMNPFQAQGDIEPWPLGLEAQPQPERFDVEDTSDLGRTYECLRQGIRDYFSKNGFQRAVIGLSGGLDSSVCVVLLADALGPKNVLGVSMPSRLTPEENREDAKTLADNLGLHLIEIPIAGITDAFAASLHPVREQIDRFWACPFAQSTALENVQAISRATLLRQLGNEFNALPIATSDKSELYLGYATVNGDMSGALAPLGDVPKTKVRALAHWLNEHRPPHVKTPQNAIPLAIIQKPPGADLKRDPKTGQLVTAEMELMPYEFADEIIWRIENLGQSLGEMLAIPFEYEKKHSLTLEQKENWLHKFYRRMAFAVFKWFVSPPILIVDGNGSITKTDYHHPIAAGKIRWQGHTHDEIASSLDRE